MKNNKVNDPQGIIQAITERLETTLEKIEVQKGQVLIDDIEKIEFCIGALKNLMIKKEVSKRWQDFGPFHSTKPDEE